MEAITIGPRQNAGGEKSKAKTPRGRVVITPELCKGCGVCVAFCPSKVLVLSEGLNQKGYHPPVAVYPEACSGCDLCGMYCPDFAIFGVRLKATTGNGRGA